MDLKSWNASSCLPGILVGMCPLSERHRWHLEPTDIAKATLVSSDSPQTGMEGRLVSKFSRALCRSETWSAFNEWNSVTSKCISLLLTPGNRDDNKWEKIIVTLFMCLVAAYTALFWELSTWQPPPHQERWGFQWPVPTESQGSVACSKKVALFTNQSLHQQWSVGMGGGW